MTIDEKLEEAQNEAWVAAYGAYPIVKIIAKTTAWSAWSSAESANSASYSAICSAARSASCPVSHSAAHLEERKKQVKMIKEML